MSRATPMKPPVPAEVGGMAKVPVWRPPAPRFLETWGVLDGMAVVCNRCGALVADVPTARQIHDRWHENDNDHTHEGT